MASVKLPETNSNTVTSWIPLTTAWPLQSGCFSSFYGFFSGLIVAFDPGYGISVEPTVSCLPPEATTWWEQDRLGLIRATTISIGPIVCPQAYITVTTSVKDSSSTFIGCCPSGYSYAGFYKDGKVGECVSDVPAGQKITHATFNYSTGWYFATETVTSATSVLAVQMHGYNFATSAFSPATGSTTAPPGQTTSGSGLPLGAKIGIGVGIPLTAIVTGILMWAFFFMRSRLRNARPVSQHPNTEYFAEVQPPVSQYHGPEVQQPSFGELDQGMMYELNTAHSPRGELPVM